MSTASAPTKLVECPKIQANTMGPYSPPRQASAHPKGKNMKPDPELYTVGPEALTVTPKSRVQMQRPNYEHQTPAPSPETPKLPQVPNFETETINKLKEKVNAQDIRIYNMENIVNTKLESFALEYENKLRQIQSKSYDRKRETHHPWESFVSYCS